MKDSISDAIYYLKKKQNKDGSWCEYVNQGGVSDVWSTAFICSILSDNSCLKVIFNDNIYNAIEFLRVNKIGELWGYNKTWIEDADSSNFVLMSLFLNGGKIDSSTLNCWLE